jgi:hypothetical protein
LYSDSKGVLEAHPGLNVAVGVHSEGGEAVLAVGDVEGALDLGALALGDAGGDLVELEVVGVGAGVNAGGITAEFIDGGSAELIVEIVLELIDLFPEFSQPVINDLFSVILELNNLLVVVVQRLLELLDLAFDFFFACGGVHLCHDVELAATPREAGPFET